jgi:hypothetical protein
MAHASLGSESFLDRPADRRASGSAPTEGWDSVPRDLFPLPRSSPGSEGVS